MGCMVWNWKNTFHNCSTDFSSPNLQQRRKRSSSNPNRNNAAEGEAYLLEPSGSSPHRRARSLRKVVDEQRHKVEESAFEEGKAGSQEREEEAEHDGNPNSGANTHQDRSTAGHWVRGSRLRDNCEEHGEEWGSQPDVGREEDVRHFRVLRY